MKTINKPAVVLLTAAAYAAIFELNSLLFSGLEYSANVNWIFLPSGLRLAFVLVFGIWGAVGIVFASIATNLIHYFDGDLTTAVVAGLISGLGPLLARSMCIHFYSLDIDLKKLTVQLLFKAATLFAVLSAVLHQLWLSYRGYSDHFISSTAAMAFGDFAGTLLLLYTAKYTITRLLAKREARRLPEF
jgi:hypothetical protein